MCIRDSLIAYNTDQRVIYLIKNISHSFVLRLMPIKISRGIAPNLRHSKMYKTYKILTKNLSPSRNLQTQLQRRIIPILIVPFGA